MNLQRNTEKHVEAAIQAVIFMKGDAMTDYVMAQNVLRILAEHIRQDAAEESRRMSGYFDFARRHAEKEGKDHDESGRV